MKKNSLTGVFVLLVFAVFMVSVLLILLSGADIVQKLTNRDQNTYTQRTAVQYLTTRIRQADRSGAVYTKESDGTSALILTEQIDGSEYQTHVYCYDGYLREMLCPAGVTLSPEFGEKILPAEAFSVSLDGSLLCAELQLSEGKTDTLYWKLRSEGGSGQ